MLQVDRIAGYCSDVLKIKGLNEKGWCLTQSIVKGWLVTFPLSLSHALLFNIDLFI